MPSRRRRDWMIPRSTSRATSVQSAYIPVGCPDQAAQTGGITNGDIRRGSQAFRMRRTLECDDPKEVAATGGS